MKTILRFFKHYAEKANTAKVKTYSHGGKKYVYDMRKPGENFCADCPDHAECMQGIPCGLVKEFGQPNYS